jgi:hypothetical protein
VPLITKFLGNPQFIDNHAVFRYIFAMSMREYRTGTVRAHELLGDYWFNSEPVPVAALRGRVILIGFWDLSSELSLRALEYWEQWQGKYESAGLVSVAVHVPRFSFGRNPGIVEGAVRRLGLTLPVVTDNGGLILSHYQLRTPPSLVLIDRDGYVRLVAEGEGSLFAIERAIQGLLLEANAFLELPDFAEPRRPGDRPGAMLIKGTPELFGGYLRGSVGNVEGATPESFSDFKDPGIHLEDRVYLEGEWRVAREAYEFGPTERGEGSLIVAYSGLEAAAVLHSTEPGGTRLEVMQDGDSIAEPMSGEDLNRDVDGRTYVHVDSPRLYGLVKNREHGSHVLRLLLKGGRVEVYALSFTAGVVPESISSN